MNAEQKARDLLAEEVGCEVDELESAFIQRDDALRAITRALQQRPSEDEVEAAAMRIMATDRRDVARVDSYWAWLMPVEQENYRRMARAALGLD